jgi:hypothetical protein
MVDTEPSGTETNLVVYSARYTCRAQISSKESKEIVFHNAEHWYPAKFGQAKKRRRFIRVLGVQENTSESESDGIIVASSCLKSK